MIKKYEYWNGEWNECDEELFRNYFKYLPTRIIAVSDGKPEITIPRRGILVIDLWEDEE